MSGRILVGEADFDRLELPATGRSVGVRGVPAEDGYPESPGPEDAWILHRLHDVTSEYDRLLDDYRFSDAMALIYNFAWSELFDWYLEMAKTPLRDDEVADGTRRTLGVVLAHELQQLDARHAGHGDVRHDGVEVRPLDGGRGAFT